MISTRVRWKVIGLPFDGSMFMLQLFLRQTVRYHLSSGKICYYTYPWFFTSTVMKRRKKRSTICDSLHCVLGVKSYSSQCKNFDNYCQVFMFCFIDIVFSRQQTLVNCTFGYYDCNRQSTSVDWKSVPTL